MAQEFIIKSTVGKAIECVWCSSIEDAAAALEQLVTNGNNVVWIREIDESADVFRNTGIWSGVEHTVAEEWIKQFGDGAEMECGALDCPELVHKHFRDWVTEQEGLLNEDWIAKAVSDYRNSVGVGFSR